VEERPVDRVAIVEAALDRAIDEAVPAPGARTPGPDLPLVEGSSLTASRARAAFEDMVTSRTLDVVARELKARGSGYYTISSAGHEDDVALGALTRPSDPAFLHYRSGALVLARARRAATERAAAGREVSDASAPDAGSVAGTAPGADVVTDILHSLMASREDPVSRGRHKVWGSRERWIVPQTSTIASQLPKAVGAALAIGRRTTMGVAPAASADVPDDAIALVSFGDASLNHATALTAVNAARWAHRRGAPVPLLFVCEDNGIGISVETPRGWVASTVSHLRGLTYVPAEGELHEVWDATRHAVAVAREKRTPVFLHLRTTRLWGHAGSDVEVAYRTREAIDAAERRDPVARTARQLIATGAADRDTLAVLVARIRSEVRTRAAGILGTAEMAGAGKAAGAGGAGRVAHLETVEEVTATLAPYRPERIVAERAERHLEVAARARIHLRGLPEHATAPGDRTLAATIRATLHDELLRYPEALVFGEDVGRKGGVYGVTAGLQQMFGPYRVFDSLLDETSILGLAQGMGLLGLLPLPEIQYLAYLHNALDQLRGEACSTSFFSDGAFTNPMVVRIAGLAYQKGFGGHFHNDNSIGALLDIPGLALAVPSRADDAGAMLRGAISMAATDGRVVAFLEPIALYHERDLHQLGDGGWLADAPDPEALLLPGEVGVHHPEAADLLIVTYGNGLRMSLRAARHLAEQGVAARVLDLRWLAPLSHDAVLSHARGCRAVLVVDECRATGGGIADAVVARLATSGLGVPIRSVASTDSYVPLGPAADAVLLSETDVLSAARQLCAVPHH
jgi:2-oxoisovalerate dehydrogenase E1 component